MGSSRPRQHEKTADWISTAAKRKIITLAICPVQLQTAAYARGVLSTVVDFHGIPDGVEEGVQARTEAQQVLDQGQRRFLFLLGQAPHPAATDGFRLTFTDPVEQDRMFGTLWHRQGLHREGRPLWKLVNTPRQRRCMVHHLCQVCGKTAVDETGRVWWLPPEPPYTPASSRPRRRRPPVERASRRRFAGWSTRSRRSCLSAWTICVLRLCVALKRARPAVDPCRTRPAVPETVRT
jgi:hypothetical protein